jgi:hypothetical protein
VLDGFYRDPGYVRDLALSLDYYRTNGLYPGFFAFASISAEPSLRLINMNGTQRQPPAEPLVFNRHYQKDFVFGIVTRAPGELQPLQRQPHFDNFCDYAGVVYLNLPEQCSGGTSFWRHRQTGLQAAPRQGSAAYDALSLALGDDDESRLMGRLMREGLAAASRGYPTESTAAWELLTVIPMRYNRCIVYDARLFHSLHIEEASFGVSLDERRLTQNLFFDFGSAPSDSPLGPPG